jgi:hypothetical protein
VEGNGESFALTAPGLSSGRVQMPKVSSRPPTVNPRRQLGWGGCPASAIAVPRSSPAPRPNDRECLFGVYQDRIPRSRYPRSCAHGATSERLGLAYHSRRGGKKPPAGTCSWRVTVDGAHATVALRIADRPLHRRAYKRATVAGTPHPPLAAAMVRLADVRPQHTVLDPCWRRRARMRRHTHLVGLRVPHPGAAKHRRWCR